MPTAFQCDRTRPHAKHGQRGRITWTTWTTRTTDHGLHQCQVPDSQFHSQRLCQPAARWQTGRLADCTLAHFGTLAGQPSVLSLSNTFCILCFVFLRHHLIVKSPVLAFESAVVSCQPTHGARPNFRLEHILMPFSSASTKHSFLLYYSSFLYFLFLSFSLSRPVIGCNVCRRFPSPK